MSSQAANFLEHPDLKFPLIIGREYYWSSSGYTHVDNTVEVVCFLAVTHKGTLIIKQQGADKKLQETQAARLLAPVQPIRFVESNADEPTPATPDNQQPPRRKLLIDEPDQPPTPKPNWKTILTFGMWRQP